MECEKLTLLSMIVCPGETISLYGCSVTGILFRENLFQGNEIFAEIFGTRNQFF